MNGDVSPVALGILRRLVTRIGRLEEQSRQQARASQASFRSVEVGSQTIRDDDGVVRAVVGAQDDGTYGVVTFGGDPLPAPSAPLVAAAPGGVTITWDGYDDRDELGWPSNLDRVRVHLSTVPGDPATQETHVASIEAGQADGVWGGAVTLAQPADVLTYCTLVAVTTSGVESGQSAEVTVAAGEGNPTAPPTVSPALTVSAGADTFVLSVGQVSASTSLVYEVAADYDPVADTGTWGTWDDMPTRSTVYPVNVLPTGDPFDPAVTYAFRVRATNGIIPDPAPSTAVVATLDLSRSLGPFVTIRDGAVTGAVDLFGTVTLPSGVAAPREAATARAAWDSVDLATASAHGLCDTEDGTGWVTYDRAQDAIVVTDKTTGALVNTFPTSSELVAGYAVTRVGPTFYVIGQKTSNGDYHILRYSQAGEYAGSWGAVAWLDVFKVPTIGADQAGNVVAGYMFSSSSARLRRFTAPTGDTVATDSYDMGTGADLGGVAIGDFGWGATRAVLCRESDGNPRVFTLAGARQNAQEWPRAAGEKVRGLWWDGTRMHSLNSVGRVYHYAANVGAEAWRVAYTNVSEDGTLETEASPELAVTRPARANLAIIAKAPPETGEAGATKANRVRIYARVGAGALWLLAALAVDRLGYTARTAPTAAATPPASNGFLGVSAPGRFRSTSGKTYVHGDDDARIPGADPWHVVGDPGQPAYAAGVTWSETTLKPAYRVDASGHLKFRGRVDASAATSGVTVFTLPAGWRPAAPIYGVAVTAGGSGSFVVARLDVLADGSVQLYWTAGATTVSLNGVSLPLDA